MPAITVDFKTMKSAKYHDKTIRYNMIGSIKDLEFAFPDKKLEDLDMKSDAVQLIINKSAFAPRIMGELAQSLGIRQELLTVEMWTDITNGYCPAKFLPADSPLHMHVQDTPRGKMVVLNRASNPIDAAGNYRPDLAAQERTMDTEFVFGLSGNLSKVIARIATEKPDFEKEISDMLNDILEKAILPEMVKDANLRSGHEGVNIHHVQELLAVSFLHCENRSVEPYYHIHFDVVNVARGFDDRLNSVWTKNIAANKSKYTGMLQMHLKERMEKQQGFVFEPVILEQDKRNEYLKDYEKNTMSYDIPDSWVPAQVREYYSKRSEEMKQAMNGQSGFIAEEIARASSREEKSDLSPAEMKAIWKNEMDSMKWDVKELLQKRDFNQVRSNKAYINDEQFVANFNRKIFEDHVRKHGPVQQDGMVAPKHLTEEEVVNELLVSNFLRKHGHVAFTESQFKSHMIVQLIHTHDKESAQRKAEQLFVEHCQAFIPKEVLESEYYKDFFNDKITDPREREQYQIRFSRDVVFIANKTLEQDKYIVEGFKKRLDEPAIMTEDEARKQAILFEQKMSEKMGKQVRFSEGQNDAFVLAMSGKGCISNVNGRAGSGKSFAFLAMKEACEDKGLNVVGGSSWNKAVEELQGSTGMDNSQCKNWSQWLLELDSGKATWDKNTVILADEMGLCDQDTMYRLATHINSSGARIICVGEKEQMQNLGASNPFKLLTDNFQTAKITEINRQREFWQREIVEDFASGRARPAIRTLHDKGFVHIYDSHDEKLQGIADKYVNTHELDVGVFKEAFIIKATYTNHQGKTESVTIDSSKLPAELPVDLQRKLESSHRGKKAMAEHELGALLNFKDLKIDSAKKIQIETGRETIELTAQQKLVISGTNYECEQINKAIRQKRIETGEMKNDKDNTVKVKCSDDITRDFSIGDRIIFSKNSKSNDFKSEKLKNSEIGTVTDFKRSQIFAEGKIVAFKVKMDSGKEVWMNVESEKGQNIKHGYASTVHKAQGATRELVLEMPSANMNNMHSAYVGMSRQKSEVHMYLSKDMVQKMAEKMNDPAPTPQMIKAARWLSAQNDLEYTVDMETSFLETRKFLNSVYYKIDDPNSQKFAPPHPTDEFVDIAEAMSQTAFNKTTFDYEILDGKQINTYRDYMKSRDEIHLEANREQERAKSVDKEMAPNKANLIDGVPEVKKDATKEPVKSDKYKAKDSPPLDDKKKKPQKPGIFKTTSKESEIDIDR